MADKKEYRSSIRSEKLIRNAFIELLQNKTLDKITVTNIADTAGLNRGTFYAHYTDIDMLIQSIEDEIVQNLCDLLSDVEYSNLLADPLPMFLKISEYLEQNQELIKALMSSRTTNPFINQLPDLIAQQLASSENVDKEENSVSFEERCRFYAGGAGSLYMAWLRGTVSGSLEEVAYKLSEIIKQQMV
ncbi:MAG: TetR/AcrR family transcriptional regulator C-terminal domain-containing protein [Lachnospiraceae bacterium]|nr:TetR/AcrR family transcriptional regulator C-terminal domain-containing protein [Lachnospiraceae bacterium]